MRACSTLLNKYIKFIESLPEGPRYDGFRGPRRAFPPQYNGGFRFTVPLSAHVVSLHEIEIDPQQQALILETALAGAKLEAEPEVANDFLYPERTADAGSRGGPDAPVWHLLPLREAALSILEINAKRRAASAKSESTVIDMGATQTTFLRKKYAQPCRNEVRRTRKILIFRYFVKSKLKNIKCTIMIFVRNCKAVILTILVLLNGVNFIVNSTIDFLLE